MFWKSLRFKNQLLQSEIDKLTVKNSELTAREIDLTAKVSSLESELGSLKDRIKACKEQKFCEVCKFGVKRTWNKYIPFGEMHKCSEMICLKNVSCEDFEKQES